MASILPLSETATSLFDTYRDGKKDESLKRFEQEHWPKLQDVCYNSYRPQVFHGFIKLLNGIDSEEACKAILRDINSGIERSANFSCKILRPSSPTEGIKRLIINISFRIGSENISCCLSDGDQNVELSKKHYTATKVVLHDSDGAFGRFFGGVGKTLLPYVPKAANSFPELSSKIAVSIEQVSKGLSNFGSTCFINAGLQMLAHELREITPTEEQHQDAFAVVLKEQIELKLRSTPLIGTNIEKYTDRNKAIQDTVSECKMQSKCKLISETMKVSDFEVDCRVELNAYFNLRQSFYSLCNELNKLTDSHDFGSERLKLINFLCCYHEFVIVTKRTNSMRLLNVGRDATTTRTNFNFIRQNDAGEFISDIYEILALSTFTCQTELKNVLYLYDKDSSLLKKFSPENTEPTNRLAVGCCGFEELTLSDVMANHFIVERLAEYNSSEHQDVHDQHDFTTKQISLFHSKDTFSGSLQIQLNLYDNRLKKPRISPSSIVLDPACIYPTEKEIRDSSLTIKPADSEPKSIESTSQSVELDSKNKDFSKYDQSMSEVQEYTDDEDMDVPWTVLPFTKELRVQIEKRKENQNNMRSFFGQEAGQVILKQQFSQSNPRSVTIKMMNKDKQFYNQEFLIDSIVCHSGGSIRSGHYRLLRFESDDSLTMCDDERVFTVSKEQGLVQFCKINGLCGYIYSLRPVLSASAD